MHRIAVGLASILLLVGCSSSATQPSGSPAPSPSATSAATSAAAFAQATPAPSEVAAAKTAVDAYTRALIGGDWAAAYAALAPESRAHWGSLANYTHDREAFFKTVAGRYMVKQPAADFGLPISMWQPAMYGAALDYSHAVLVEVDYPALAGNNAGYNLYVVQPTPSGLAIFDVR